MTIARIYHVGIVVSDLQSGMEQLTDVTGVSWGRVQRYAVGFITPTGPRTFEQTFVMTLEGPPYIELLVATPGSVWERTGMHHLGLWSEDVPGESARAEAQGCMWEQAIADADGSRAGGCYHILPSLDARIELVSRASSGPRLQRYLAGGDYS
jgi:hypothetical protein